MNGMQMALDFAPPVVRCFICDQDHAAEPFPPGHERAGFLAVAVHLHPLFPAERCIGSRQVSRPDRCRLPAAA